MTRVLVHLGLAAALVVAPVLCCCQARAAAFSHQTVLHAPAPASDVVPATAFAPIHSCCGKAKQSAPQEPAPAKPAEPLPSPHAPPTCACCLERPVATQTERAPVMEAAAPTGELLPLAVVALTAGCAKHSGLGHGLDVPDRAGVDVRFASLFERHVLRC